MIQEQKDLLLKDVVSRLLYPLFVTVRDIDNKECEPFEVIGFSNNLVLVRNSIYLPTGHYEPIDVIKPYLRPMSSMTEEEYKEYELTFDNVVVYSGHNNNNIHSEHRPTYKTFDYLDSIHVDYRDLIPKGLALEVSEDMYKF